MTVLTNIISARNVRLQAGDATLGTDFLYPSPAGVAIPATARSWSLTVDKSQVPLGQRYLVVAVEYQRLAGWSVDASNAPDGWVGGNMLDGVPNTTDHLASEIGWTEVVNGVKTPMGEMPSHARLHVLFSSGATLASVQLQLTDDYSLA